MRNSLLNNIIDNSRNLTNSEFIMYVYGRLNYLQPMKSQHEKVIKLDSAYKLEAARRDFVIQVANNKWIEHGDVDLVSIHIPKTAGTTLRVHLDEQYTNERVKVFYGDWRDVQTANNDIKILHGHFHDSAKFVKARPDAKKITWLRDPIMRLISEYHFWMSSNKRHNHVVQDEQNMSLYDKVIFNNLTFEEYVQIPECHNSYTSYWLKGVDLTKFDFIGITEKFSTDINHMRESLGWPATAKTRRTNNKNRFPSYQDRVDSILQNKILISQLKERNSDDYNLYYNHGGVDIHI